MSFGPRRAKVLGYLSVQLVSEISNICDPDPPRLQADRQTDRRTTCNRKTALCTVVHLAVKITINAHVVHTFRNVKVRSYNMCIGQMMLFEDVVDRFGNYVEL